MFHPLKVFPLSTLPVIRRKRLWVLVDFSIILRVNVSNQNLFLLGKVNEEVEWGGQCFVLLKKKESNLFMFL